MSKLSANERLEKNRLARAIMSGMPKAAESVVDLLQEAEEPKTLKRLTARVVEARVVEDKILKEVNIPVTKKWIEEYAMVTIFYTEGIGNIRQNEQGRYEVVKRSENQP